MEAEAIEEGLHLIVFLMRNVIEKVIVTFGALLVISARTRPDHQLLIRFWKPDWRGFGEVFRLGWPIGLTSLAEAGCSRPRR